MAPAAQTEHAVSFERLNLIDLLFILSPSGYSFSFSSQDSHSG
jgi:hypothetical protein